VDQKNLHFQHNDKASRGGSIAAEGRQHSQRVTTADKQQRSHFAVGLKVDDEEKFKFKACFRLGIWEFGNYQ